MGLQEIRSRTELGTAFEDNKIVVVAAYTLWCSTWTMISHSYLALSQLYPDVHFVTYDSNILPEISSELHVYRTPSFYFFIKGHFKSELCSPDLNRLQDRILLTIKEATRM